MSFRPEAYRVLVVDDDPGMRLAMTETLKRKKYQVDQAQDGKTGLSLVAQHTYQVMITDLRMPGLSGLELLHEVKKLSPATEVILVTAYGTVPTAVEAMKEGAYDFIQKPFSAPDLEKIVYNALVRNVPEHVLKTDPGQKHHIVTKSEKMLAMLDMAKRAAASNATVLIQAESGTGKELLARFICQHSPRAQQPIVAINCAALPDNLLESELFGYEKGSFTGALNSKPGKFEIADGGTILLDEIGEMPMGLQAKLLRVLQEQEVDRIGGKSPIPVDVRVIAMTNRDLKKRISDGGFREDLFYRLNVIPLEIPALHERSDDIEALIQFFIAKHGDGTAVKLAPSALRIAKKYHWPGNVRELENAIQRALILRSSDILEIADLFRFQEDVLPEGATDEAPLPPAQVADESNGKSIRLMAGTSVSEMERKLIELTLEETDGNKTHAAKMLGISLRTLRNKLKEYGE